MSTLDCKDTQLPTMIHDQTVAAANPVASLLAPARSIGDIAVITPASWHFCPTELWSPATAAYPPNLGKFQGLRTAIVDQRKTAVRPDGMGEKAAAGVPLAHVWGLKHGAGYKRA